VGSFSRDITDRKRIDKELARSEERFRLVTYATNDAVWDWDLSADQIWWNQNIRRLFGYSTEQVRSDVEWWESRLHPDDRQKVMASLQSTLEGGQEFWSKEFRFRRADGTYAHVFDRGYVTHDEHGKPVRILGAMMDITEWRAAEKAMEADRNLLRMVIDLLPDYIYVKDPQGRVVLDNIADARELGAASPEEIIGKTVYDYFPPELAEKYFADDQAVIKTGQKILAREEPRVDAAGNQTWLLTTKVPLLDDQGKITGLVGIGHDITSIKKAEQELQEANRKQTDWIVELERRTRETGLLNEMSDLLQTCQTFGEAYKVIGDLTWRLFPQDAGGLYIISDSRNNVELVSSWGSASVETPVFAPEDCWGLRLGRLHVNEQAGRGEDGPGTDAPTMGCSHLPPDSPDACLCVPLAAQGEAIGLLHIRHQTEAAVAPGTSGRWFGEDRQDLARAVGYRVGLALANIKLRETLRQQSIRDALTGLFNRRYMEASLEREAYRVIRNQRSLGIVMLDIDHFKDFNDTFGHEAGDAVLRELGALLRSKVRAEDIACRYGGEEFVLILPDASLEVTGKRAEMLREAVKHLDVSYNDQPLGAITVSCGVAALPDHGPNMELVMRAADVALYQAKNTGRDRVVLADVAQEAAETAVGAHKPANTRRTRKTD
jgi:diguanylate cyclase (GGDEF)-like protein/PAS domain S-box-containing protein